VCDPNLFNADPICRNLEEAVSASLGSDVATDYEICLCECTYTGDSSVGYLGRNDDGSCRYSIECNYDCTCNCSDVYTTTGLPIG
jgi:hypothetical protein